MWARGSVVCVLDIEDGSVGVSIVALKKKGPSEVVSAKRALLSLEQHTAEKSPQPLMTLLDETITQVLSAYTAFHAAKAGPVHAVHAYVHAPWTHVRIASTEDRFDAPKSITKAMISDLAKKAITQPSNLDKGNILEAGVMQVYVNGYPTANPVGTKGVMLSVVVCEADIHSEAKSLLVNVLGKHFPGRTPSLHAGMRAFLTVAHEHFPDTYRYIIVDVNSFTTTAAVIVREAMSQEATIPEGALSIVKRVAPTTGLPEETLAQLKMLESDYCATPACAALKESLARAEPDLVKSFAELFAQLAAKRRTPNICLLSVHAHLAPWLTTFLARIDFAQFTATTQPLSVETLTPEHVKELVVWSDGVAPDAGLGISIGAVHILATEDN